MLSDRPDWTLTIERHQAAVTAVLHSLFQKVRNAGASRLPPPTVTNFLAAVFKLSKAIGSKPELDVNFESSLDRLWRKEFERQMRWQDFRNHLLCMRKPNGESVMLPQESEVLSLLSI